MKSILTPIIVLLAIIYSFSQYKKTELVIIGNIHEAAPNYNADTLYTILEQIKPDIILHEIDSSFFTKDFKFKYPSKGNEQNASEKYLKTYPQTLIRPFEFEGRNQYRRAEGMVPTDNLTIQLLDSLYHAGALSPQESEIVKTYYKLSEQLNAIATTSPKNFNNSRTDSISEQRQHFQHKRLTQITNKRPEFANRFVTKPNGEKISYRDGYQLWADFWDLRNKTMARNILKIAEQNPGRRIVVLTGFFHRYYLLKELKKGNNIQIKEYYEY